MSFFKRHRRVEHRDGSWPMKTAALKKSIYSPPEQMELLREANRRHLEFIATLDDPRSARKDLEKIAVALHDGERSLRGFNRFGGEDPDLFQPLLRGEFNLSGLRNKYLAQRLKTAGPKVSWMLKRLRAHGLIKKIGPCRKHCLTALGRRVAATAARLREMTIIPSLDAAHARG